MLKKVFISIIVLLLVIGAGVVFFFDSMVKSGIEVVGSQVLGSAVTVSSVSISPLNGSGSISGLKIANPEGFNADYVIELELVEININVSSVFSDVIEIELVRIIQPEITYETRITTDNIRALMANLSFGEASSDEVVAEDAAGPQIVIRQLQILDPQLNLVTAIVTAPIPLPDIEMQDIGAEGEGDSASVGEVLRTVLARLSGSILNTSLPDIGELTESLKDEVEDAVEGAVEDLGNRLRNILN